MEPQIRIQGSDMASGFLNSIAVTIPATVIPIAIAAFAAYGFAWIKFPGRKMLFALVVGLLVVPLQISLIPLLQNFVALHLNGTFLSVWLAHTGFGLPLATYLLFNYISELPRDIFEAAHVDGASHFKIFTNLVLPLSVPALASFAIFQFLWVWNDYLVALVFLGGGAIESSANSKIGQSCRIVWPELGIADRCPVLLHGCAAYSLFLATKIFCARTRQARSRDKGLNKIIYVIF